MEGLMHGNSKNREVYTDCIPRPKKKTDKKGLFSQ